MSMMPASDRLIVALDTPTTERARALVRTLGSAAGIYKIGLELALGGGLAFVEDLVRTGKRVFLDMKLLDIPNTVERATANAARLGIEFLTVHGQDRKTLEAAVRGRGRADTKLLAVTVLTSLDAADLREQGIAGLSPVELTVARAKLAAAAGFDGVVASSNEAAAIRDAVGAGLLIVTPGIRPAGEAPQDQTRVATPATAIRAGATHLVVGRPITAAVDPAAAATSICREIDEALRQT
ncbi:MAG TPA: orotidine-5'-phosphate decarboxylase [Hyphomicrobiaceae bacterium]|nr:orotidine-5'-phosphate decarboxylase [Hyphomicrobiaceae bacterium]